MIVTTEPGAIEDIIRSFRRTMRDNAGNPNVPDIVKTTCRMAEGTFPGFLAALVAEMRAETIVDHQYQAVADLCANMIATVISSSLPASGIEDKARAGDAVMNSIGAIVVKHFRHEEEKRAAQVPPKEEMN